MRHQFGDRFYAASQAIDALAARTVRASSLVENLNSRLRTYFSLRRHLGPDYLNLLQFFLNHRVLERSERPEREGKTPAELLTGQCTRIGWSCWASRGSLAPDPRTPERLRDPGTPRHGDGPRRDSDRPNCYPEKGDFEPGPNPAVRDSALWRPRPWVYSPWIRLLRGRTPGGEAPPTPSSSAALTRALGNADNSGRVATLKALHDVGMNTCSKHPRS